VTRCRCSRQRGLAMTEMAVVLPLMLMFILATAEFGRAFWQFNVLTKSVQDGARFAAGRGLFGSTEVVVITDDLRQEVGNLVVYGNTSGNGSTILPGLSTTGVTIESPGGGDVLVRSRYAYAPLFGFVPTFDGSGIATVYDFEAVVRMRAL
jgi:hypothetical protein